MRNIIEWQVLEQSRIEVSFVIAFLLINIFFDIFGRCKHCLENIEVYLCIERAKQKYRNTNSAGQSNAEKIVLSIIFHSLVTFVWRARAKHNQNLFSFFSLFLSAAGKLYSYTIWRLSIFSPANPIYKQMKWQTFFHSKWSWFSSKY